MERIKIKRLGNNRDLPLPSYKTTSSAGMDLIAAVEEDIIIEPGKRALIGTGIAIALPAGYEAQIRPRSGLALKNGIALPNSPGTIDADYRGEVGVILINLGQESFVIQRGMRIAQMVITSCVQAIFDEVEDLDDTERGAGGFGSTGV